MATLTVTTTTDYRGGAAETNIDEIAFAAGAAATATFGSDQFGSGLISNSVQITGDGFDNTIIVHAVSGIIAAQDWTLTNWSASDVILLLGTTGAETIAASNAGSIIQGGGGGDQLFGGISNDTFRYLGGEAIGSDRIEDFNTGDLDAIQIGDNAGSLDFTSTVISDVERLEFTSGAATVSLDSIVFGVSGMTSVVGGTGADSLLVKIRQGAIVANLADVAFTSWTGGIDTITISGTTAGDIMTGSSQNETINGGAGNDNISGGRGADTLNGGDGDDTFRFAPVEFQANESVDGGAGTNDRLELPAAAGIFHFFLGSVTGVEALDFVSGGAAFFAGTQVGSGAITAVDGGTGANTFQVIGASIDLSVVTFTNWTAGTDFITLVGTNGADTLTGSSQNDTLLGQAGADTMSAGTGDDIFQISANDIAAGESLNGGDGLDRLNLFSGTAFDFTGVTLASVEALRFGGTSTVTLNAAQIGASGISSVQGAGIDALIVNGALADLSAVTFTFWTNGSDTIRLNGTGGDDSLTGSSQFDTLNGGDGNDTLGGGLGDDAIDGGAGTDTAVFAGGLSSYTLQEFGDTIIVSGAEGNDTLTGIEFLQFADGTIDPDDGNPLFDTPFYLSHNIDVFQAGVNALQHYNTFGFHEARDPNAFFDTSGYLAFNKDVAAAGVNPLEHFHVHGWKEGRDPSLAFDTTLYLLRNPDVAAAQVDPLQHFLEFGIAEGRASFQAVGPGIVAAFDAQFYLFVNPDVAAAGVDPFAHYDTHGRHEGRNPNAFFDTAGYLSHTADVAAAGVNPLQHYDQHGWKEGRDPSAAFDTLGYLAANPDVAAAGVNPLDHFLRHGIYEGRAAINDGLFD